MTIRECPRCGETTIKQGERCPTCHMAWAEMAKHSDAKNVGQDTSGGTSLPRSDLTQPPFEGIMASRDRDTGRRSPSPMPVRLCPRCQMTIPARAHICPFCKKRLRVSTGTVVVLSLIGILVFAAILSSPDNAGHQGSMPVSTTGLEQSINEMLRAGAVTKIEPDYHDAWMMKSDWDMLSYDTKNTLCAMLATYCAMKKGTTTYFVTVRDHNSGKTLGEWSQTWGLSVK